MKLVKIKTYNNFFHTKRVHKHCIPIVFATMIYMDVDMKNKLVALPVH